MPPLVSPYMRWLALVALCGCTRANPQSLSRDFDLAMGGTDLSTAQPDLAVALPDLASRDLSARDLASQDLAGRDLVTVTNPDLLGCVPASSSTLLRFSLDTIFVVDTSGSMVEEIAGFESALPSYAQTLTSRGIDHRIILVGEYGNSSLTICIPAPLGGHNCSTQLKPTNTASFFHYDAYIDSLDSFTKIPSTLKTRDPSCDPSPAPCTAANGWIDWLRPTAQKVFVEISDDNSGTTTAATFDTNLLAASPAQFGNTGARRYVWNTITGVEENVPITTPWTAAQLPVSIAETDKCSTAVQAGIQYQQLAMLTDGVAFPVCAHPFYASFFQTIAARAATVPPSTCRIDLFGMDPTTVALRFGSRVITRVSSAGACSGDTFYDDGFDAFLCPEICARVRSDAQPTVFVDECL